MATTRSMKTTATTKKTTKADKDASNLAEEKKTGHGDDHNKTNGVAKAPIDEPSEEEEAMTMSHYISVFHILLMNGFLCHNRQYWRSDPVVSIVLLILYVTCGTFIPLLWPKTRSTTSTATIAGAPPPLPIVTCVRNVLFLLHCVWLIKLSLAGQPSGANHKNMLCMVSLILLPAQVRQCYHDFYGGSAARQMQVMADSLNLVRWAVFIMYFMAGFHKINDDFLFEPTVSCAFDKIYYYIELFGYEDLNDLPWWFKQLPWTVLFVEIVPALTLLVPKWQWQIPSVANFILLHLILLPMGFADFGSIAQSFLLLFVSPTAVANSGLTLNFFLSMVSMFIIFQTCTLVHWYLWQEDEVVPFEEGEMGLVLMAYGLMWGSLLPAAPKANEGVPVWRPKTAFGWVPLVFFLWWAMNPYLGLRTAGNLTMFSNLTTEGKTSNHLLLRNNPLKIFGYQDDQVEIVELEEPLGRKVKEGAILTRINFDVALQSNVENYLPEELKGTPITIRYKGETLETEDLFNDPAFAQFLEPRAWWEKKFFNMRPIHNYDDGPKECSW